MVDMRYEFDRIIDEYGSDIMYVRNDKKKICSCVDTLHGSPKDKCPICLGTGHINRVEKIEARMVTASIPETLPRMVNNAEPGAIAVPSKQFYIRDNIRPRRNDLIVSCQWDGKKPIFDEYTEIYKVNESEPVRGDGGRIEYFIAYAHGDPINADIKLTKIRENAKIQNYIAIR